jgi:phytoene desaturase
MNQINSQTFRNPKTVQFFNRFATYNGSNPYIAPATLNIIPHLEFGVGTYFPIKGMNSITHSLFELAQRHGVVFHFNAKVNRITNEKNKATGIEVGGKIMLADAVISNMDVFPTYKKLLPQFDMPKQVKHVESSSSALIFYWGINHSFKELGLHNILFSENYQKEFETIFDKQRIDSDPTIYINISSKCKADDAPTGCENWFVMINVPSNQGQDWDTLIQEARQNIISKINRILKTDIETLIANESILDPRSIEGKTSSFRGALYGSSSNNVFSAFFRHPNFSRKINNLYFCGGSVHPGGGIPLCLLSAKIAVGQIS